MRSSYLDSHPLLSSGQSLWFDGELCRLTLLDADQRIEQQCALPLEVLTFLADLFAAHPASIECDEPTQMLLGTCHDFVKVLHLAIERVTPGSYRLVMHPPTQEHPVQREASPHPLVSVRRDWRRGMYTIPPFLL